MQSNTEDCASTVESTLPYSNRCLRVCGGVCIAISTMFFLGSVVGIVWIFENKQPMRYAVVCFMIGAGVLYISAFTSSLLLLTREIHKRSRTISREVSTECVRNNGGYEVASDISYRQGTNFLQVPQRTIVRKTPPPPYDDPARNSTEQEHTSQNNIDESAMGEQYTRTITNEQVTDDAGLTLNRVYYELNKDDVQRDQVEHGIELLQLPTLKNVTTGSFKDDLLTCAMRQQVASKSSRGILNSDETSSLISQNSSSGNSGYRDVADSDCSSRSERKNHPQIAKQKLKARLSVSHSDLNSERIPQYSETNLNSEMWTSHSNLNPKMKSSHTNLNQGIRTSNSNLNQGIRTSNSNLNQGIRTSNSNLNQGIRTSNSNLNLGIRTSNYNLDSEKIRSSYNEKIGLPQWHSNAKMQETPPLLGFNANGETMQSKLIPENQELCYRSDGKGNVVSSQLFLNVPGTSKDCKAEVHTSQSNLNLEKRPKDCRSDYNEIGLPQVNSESPGTSRVSRSNVEVRTSQSNLIPVANRYDYNKEIRLSQSNLKHQGTPKVTRSNVDLQPSQSNMVSERKPLSLQHDWDARSSSPSNLRPVELFSRTNATRTSQLNLNYEGPQTSPSSLNVVMEIPEYQKPESSVIYERPQFEPKFNYRVHPDQRFTSNSNFHSNPSDQKSNSNVQLSAQMMANTSFTDSDIFLSKPTSKRIQTIPQPKQFVACSKEAATLQKAQSFQSLSVTSPPRIQEQTHLKSAYKYPEEFSNRQKSGRSTESVLDKTRNCQEMNPEEWRAVWDKGFRKILPKDADRIVGVRL